MTGEASAPCRFIYLTRLVIIVFESTSIFAKSSCTSPCLPGRDCLPVLYPWAVCHGPSADGQKKRARMGGKHRNRLQTSIAASTSFGRITMPDCAILTTAAVLPQESSSIYSTVLAKYRVSWPPTVIGAVLHWVSSGRSVVL